MASLLSYALTTVNDVKELLDIPTSDSTKNNLIIRKINAATKMIENYCGRRFQATTYENVLYDATNSDELVLRQRPVLEFESFGSRDTSMNDEDWDDVDPDFYFIDKTAGIIKLNFNSYGHWDRYRVTYTAGYYTIPEDIAEAAATLAAFLVTNGISGTNVKSKQEGQRKLEYFEANTSSLIDQLGLDEILKSYANYPLGGI